ncbi:MAG: MATE family efflux transporter [Bacteriovoracaceae bacterium]|nr:MATE family efflux transporter [Bacteriovoracaceae bacterium]
MTYNDLTKGSILGKITRVSLPIMGTSFVHMAYNLTDMYWLGQVGSKAVAAVGAAGLITWFVQSLLSFLKTGAEVNVAQSIGAGNTKRAERYARNALYLSFVLGTITCIIVGISAGHLISFFKLKEVEVINDATTYLRICSVSLLASIVMVTMNGIYNGIGRSKIPFVINSIGLVGNIILDPIFIYHFNMGAAGAGIATVISHLFALSIFIYFITVVKPPFEGFSLVGKLSKEFYGKIIKVGFPPAIHYAAFSFFAMVITRIVSGWGATAIAVQSLGSQIESLTWMTALGLSTALSSFVGQNFGARQYKRIFKGYVLTLALSSCFGIMATLLLMFGGHYIYQIFMPEPDAIRIGSEYLWIMAFSQIFMTLEITTAGIFNGFGKTLPPSFVGIFLTGLRIPLALVLSVPLGLAGVWWSITITSILKGIVLYVWFFFWHRTGNYRTLAVE